MSISYLICCVLYVGSAIVSECCSSSYVCCFFFFQAEDGIRDLVRSRGLGDVYKRQVYNAATDVGHAFIRQHHQASQVVLEMSKLFAVLKQIFKGSGMLTYQPVSYTHLTLPTSDLV